MKRPLTATAAILVMLGMPAHGQVSGIDTTTTETTDARIDITPPSMETGAEIVIDDPSGQDVEAQGDADFDDPDAEAENEIDLDASLPVKPTVRSDMQNEFEPEPEIDLDAALNLQLNEQ